MRAVRAHYDGTLIVDLFDGMTGWLRRGLPGGGWRGKAKEMGDED